MGLVIRRVSRRATTVFRCSNQQVSRDDLLQQILEDQGVSMKDIIELQGLLMASNTDANNNDRQLSLQSLGIDKSILKDIPGQSTEQDKQLEDKKAANKLKSESIKEAKKKLKEGSVNTIKKIDESTKKGLSNASTALKRPVDPDSIVRSEESASKPIDSVPRQISADRIVQSLPKTKGVSYRKDPTAFGVTLENMVDFLIKEKGYDYIFDRTDIKIFSEPVSGKRPSNNSILKLLRNPDMLWARKKIESLYRSSQER